MLDNLGLTLTDKASPVHDYLRKYEKYFPFQRDANLKILEIGVQTGGSLKLWKQYYTNSKIIGIDINPRSKEHEEDRITIEIGSQFDSDFLKYIANKYGPFDIIIDDGSHFNQHIIFSFENLFEYLKPQGIYVVEDSVTSYWIEFGGGLNEPNSVISYFKNRIDEVNFYGERLESPYSNMIGQHARKDSLLIDQMQRKGYNAIGFDIESINFLNSIIIVRKR